MIFGSGLAGGGRAAALTAGFCSRQIALLPHRARAVFTRSHPFLPPTHPNNPLNTPQNPKNKPKQTKKLRHVLTNIGEKLSPQEMDALVAEADTKGDGRVERESFVRLLMAK